jgi:hypothetical protein
MTFLSQRVYGDILLLVQHYMVEVDITVDCNISGNKDDFVYDTENTLYKFIEDLQEVGMAWAKEHQPHGAGIMVDGRSGYPIGFTGTSHPFSMGSGIGITLHDLGVKSGSVVTIFDEVSHCGPGSQPIVFYCTEGIEYPSSNWKKQLSWTNGMTLTGVWAHKANQAQFDGGREGVIGDVLPKKVNFKSVYVTLYGYGENGQIKTFAQNRCLDEIKHMVSHMFEEREIHEPQFSMGWICFLSSKPFRRRLGE